MIYAAENIWATSAPKILKFVTNVSCMFICGMNIGIFLQFFFLDFIKKNRFFWNLPPGK